MLECYSTAVRESLERVSALSALSHRQWRVREWTEPIIRYTLILYLDSYRDLSAVLTVCTFSVSARGPGPAYSYTCTL